MNGHLGMLRNAPVLENVPADEMEQLAALVQTVELQPSETFVMRGQPSPGMVLVDSGSLEVLLDSAPICSLSPGSVFAEEALVSDVPSPATLRAATKSRIGVLERRAVEEQLDLMPGLWQVLDRAWRHRVLAARLYSIDLFRDLPPNARQELADAFEPVDLAPGTILAREGQPLDCLYVIREGQAEVELAGHEDDMTLLRAGEAIGGFALIGDSAQPATVSAPYGLRAMKLTREALGAVLERFPGALAAMRDAAHRRKDSAL